MSERATRGAKGDAKPEDPPRKRAEVVYRWDLDKTYIQTDFHSLTGLLRAMTETPAEKRPVPGMRALLQALSRSRDARIIVVSGSPEMMRSRIAEMFELHGIRCDRLVLKPWAGAIAKGRFRNIRAQIAYKLRAHIETRLWLRTEHADAPEHCFGDDAEVDALVYCLYNDVCARRIDATALRALLQRCGAYEDEIAEILQLLAELPRDEPVRRVFVHLDARSPPARYAPYRGRVTATFDAFQIAVSLAEAGHADDGVVAAVVNALVAQHRVDADAFAGSLEDAVARGLAGRDCALRLAQTVLPATEAAAAGFDEVVAARLSRRLQSYPAKLGPRTFESLPYDELLTEEAAFAAARRLARKTAVKVGSLTGFLNPRDR